MKKIGYWIFLVLLNISIIGTFLYLAAPLLQQSIMNWIVRDPVSLLTMEEKEELYRIIASDLQGIYEAVPDPDVGKILQRNISKTQRGATVISNNAGFRSNIPFSEDKGENVFRIVCLGDSFVEGTGGPVEDRFCTQLGDTINEGKLLGENVVAETYAVGVGSWTAVNAATYMISHLDAYKPDLIIVMLVDNDIADGQGVTGTGMSANNFSPEYRRLGSAVYGGTTSRRFGEDNFSKFDFGNESQARWNKAFSRYRRLEALQHQSGGKMLFSVLNTVKAFTEVAKSYSIQHGISSPFLVTNYFPSKDTLLPHDPHPNRKGHKIIADHYLHAMLKLGWVSDKSSIVSALHPGLTLELQPKVDHEVLKGFRSIVVESQLPTEIRFDSLRRADKQALMMGIWPNTAEKNSERQKRFPHGSIKSTFLLARDRNSASARVEIFIPEKLALFPNTIELFVNGQKMDNLHLKDVTEHGSHELSADLSWLQDDVDILEMSIRSQTYWAEIEDDTMRSYELRRAWQ